MGVVKFFDTKIPTTTAGGQSRGGETSQTSASLQATPTVNNRHERITQQPK
jgi:hypothetical protein